MIIIDITINDNVTNCKEQLMLYAELPNHIEKKSPLPVHEETIFYFHIYF